MSNLSDGDSAGTLYEQSLNRCVEQGGFLDRFYELFIASSPEVREKFKNTDFARQKDALRASLYLMMNIQDWTLSCDSHMEALANRHSRQNLDIRPELYDLWLDCLLQAVRECDPLYDDAVESSWKKVLQPSIDFLKSHY